MKIDGVILAAGYSSRAGGFKPSFIIDGKSLIQITVEGIYDFCENVFVVVGFNSEIVSNLLKSYPKVKIIENEFYQNGMFTSIKCGLRNTVNERIFIMPGDYPFDITDVAKQMIQVNGEIIIPSYNNKKGHPVLITSNIAKEIMKESDEYNLRYFFNKKEITYYETNKEEILYDIDTQEDYLNALKITREKYDTKNRLNN